jgi:WD40 repeat protein
MSSFDGTIKVWDPTQDQEKFLLSRHADRVFRVVFSPDGREALMTHMKHVSATG